MTRISVEMLNSEEGRRLYRHNALYNATYKAAHHLGLAAEQTVIVRALQSACRELDELKAEKAAAWARAPFIIMRENTNA